MTDRWLSTERAAKYLDTSVGALRQRMNRGTLPSWTWARAGRSLRFDRLALDQWLEDQIRRKRAAVAKLESVRRAS